MHPTCWSLLFVAMYIARSSAKSGPITSPNIQLIFTRKKVTLSSPPSGIPKPVYLLSEINFSTLILIHLSPICSLMNSIILPCIPMFSSCSSVFSLSYAFLISKKIAAAFSFLLNPLRIIVVIFYIASIALLCFLQLNCFHLLFSPLPSTRPVSCLSSFQIFCKVYL